MIMRVRDGALLRFFLGLSEACKIIEQKNRGVSAGSWVTALTPACPVLPDLTVGHEATYAQAISNSVDMLVG